MVAGAPALVVSLWRVDERSTRILMLKFYAGLMAGLGAASALKQAQLFVRDLSRRDVLALLGALPEFADGAPDDRPFADPFHWAPFILIGAAG
jgi:CHAT domain-containing protein